MRLVASWIACKPRPGACAKPRQQTVPLLRTQHSVLPGFTLSFALSVLFISLVILVPLSGLAIHVSQMSWAQYWGVITDPRSLASFRVTLLAAAGASGINAVVGLLNALLGGGR